MVYVLDTHAIVWFLEKSPRLSSTARDVMLDPMAELVIPAIALLEIKFLYARGRIASAYEDIRRDIIDSGNCVIYPVDEQIVSLTPTTLNIHDAIIVATTLVYRDVLNSPSALITKDRAIHSSGLVDCIW
ncbi:MAG TPA: PIN domain-containing protein [Pyrinomonadaceae bacterium]|nr:PIN domain-containing protein [Pyrinomonadaceae bacterium]